MSRGKKGESETEAILTFTCVSFIFLNVYLLPQPGWGPQQTSKKNHASGAM